MTVYVSPLTKKLSFITHPHVVPNPFDFRSPSKHKWIYFKLNLRGFCHNYHFVASKRS